MKATPHMDFATREMFGSRDRRSSSGGRVCDSDVEVIVDEGFAIARVSCTNTWDHDPRHRSRIIEISLP